MMLDLIFLHQNSALLYTSVFILGLVGIELMSIIFGGTVSEMLSALFVNSDIKYSKNKCLRMLGQFCVWLHIGQVPFFVVLILFLSLFVFWGLLYQYFFQIIFNLLLPSWLMIPAALYTAAVNQKIGLALLNKYCFKEESTVVSQQDFVGKFAQITLGTAKKNYPAEAKVIDQFGYSHYVMVEPEASDEVLHTGASILLIECKENLYLAIKKEKPF
tara:strand:+ start:256 stop:903 length:648 start_codon:yes stop_codon:yes gene_type:complete